MKPKLKKILEIEIRNDELGVLLYLNESNTNAIKANGDKLKYESFFQMVTKKYDGKWKIENYSY